MAESNYLAKKRLHPFSAKTDYFYYCKYFRSDPDPVLSSDWSDPETIFLVKNESGSGSRNLDVINQNS